MRVNNWLKAHVIEYHHNGKIYPSRDELMIRYSEGLHASDIKIIKRYGPFVQTVTQK